MGEPAAVERGRCGKNRNMNTKPNDPVTPGDERHTVATYVSDMLALERHIIAPIESQDNSEDHQSDP